MENIKINEEAGEYMKRLLSESEIEVEEEKLYKMLFFLELLYERNKVMNLTAIRDRKGMVEKHFIDSLLLTKIIREDEKKIIDVGTGGGFPGLVLAIYYPEKEFLLVDSVKKKVEFINEVIEKLKLSNVKTSYERAEELIKKNRETFDTALCRGVANLRIILEYMIPFIKLKGRFLPQKLNINELEEAGNALQLLNASVERVHSFELPDSKEGRVIMEIVKNGKTDRKYPRKTGIPAKKPL